MCVVLARPIRYFLLNILEEDFRLSRHQEQLTVHSFLSPRISFFFSGGDFGYSSSFLADRRRNHIRLCLSEEPSPFYIILLALFFRLSR